MKNYFYLLTISLFLMSCVSEELEISVPEKLVSIPVERMELEAQFEAGTPEEFKAKNDILLEKYKDVYILFVGEFMRLGDARDPMIGNHLSLTSKTGGFDFYNEVNMDLATRFKSFEVHHKEIETALNRYKSVYPDSTLPKRIVTLNSYFNAQAFVTSDDDLCIGLDMFVGTNSPFIQKLPKDVFPNFLTKKMSEDFLVVNAMQAWLLEKCYRVTGDDFLDNIVATGKIMYLLEKHLPEHNEERLMQYTKEELEWCVTNEAKMWKQLVDEKTLYTKDPMLVDNWIKDAPFTKGLPSDSPSRIGRWIGLQMVRDFMEQNPGVTLPELVEEKNSKRILKFYNQGE